MAACGALEGLPRPRCLRARASSAPLPHRHHPSSRRIAQRELAHDRLSRGDRGVRRAGVLAVATLLSGAYVLRAADDHACTMKRQTVVVSVPNG